MNATDRDRLDRLMLKRAALVALRGEGHVEPNPMVGCVIGREMGAGVEVLGIGHHRRYGDKHAEVEALEDARRRAAGEVAEMLRGATAWVTLEPCCHFGKQPPCTDALIAAGIGRVVYARRDPNAISAGGAEKLRAAGIVAEERPLSRLALAVSEPFIKRVTTGLPWVIAKWAQTMDGRIATRTGESKWISGEASRRRVHVLRGRVDAIVTGIGTVKTDDPMLTARGVPVRRMAKRVLVDPDLEVSLDAKLVRSAKEVPLIVAACAGAMASGGEVMRERRAALERAGATVIVVERENGLLSLGAMLSMLASEFDVGSVLAEGGAGLVGRLLGADLIDEALVFTAGMMLGDERALPPAKGNEVVSLAAARRFELMDTRRVGGDVMTQWRRK